MSGPPFDQPAECGGLILFMLVRIIKVLELAFRLISTCRGAVRGRAAMVGADFLLSVLIFLIIAVGAGRGCQEWEGGEWYGDSVGTCDWRVTIALFWTGFFEVVFGLGHRQDYVMLFNTYRQTRLKGAPCCLGVYGWQLWTFNFLLDFIAAIILNTTGCHLGWGVVIAGPFGLFAKWYAFGVTDSMIADDTDQGTELPPLPPSQLEAQTSPPARHRQEGAEAGAAARAEEPSDTLSKDL